MIYPIVYPSGCWGDSVIAFLNCHFSNTVLQFSDNPHMQKQRCNMPMSAELLQVMDAPTVGAVQQKGFGHHALPDFYYNYLGTSVFPIVIYTPELWSMGKNRMYSLLQLNQLDYPMNDLQSLEKKTSEQIHNKLKTTVQRLEGECFHLDIHRLFIEQDENYYYSLCNYVGVTAMPNASQLLTDINNHCEIDKWMETV